MSVFELVEAMGLTPIGVIVMVALVGLGLVVATHTLLKRANEKISAEGQETRTVFSQEGQKTRETIRGLRDRLLAAHEKSDEKNHDAHTAMREKLSHLSARVNGRH